MLQIYLFSYDHSQHAQKFFAAHFKYTADPAIFWWAKLFVRYKKCYKNATVTAAPT